jgi:predicted ferric reductase
MEQYIVKIKSINSVTHDVLKMVTEKPEHYNFISGQATEIAINKEGWKNEKRPFTFTALPTHNDLEFTIKTYPAHKGVTHQLQQLKQGDELILHDVFGAIQYQGEGLFIAGGAGVTPFISILRYLQSKNATGSNKLLFANKARVDIILGEEFKKMLGINFINVLSDEKVDGYVNGFITEDLIQSLSIGVNPFYYVCGPPPMMEAVAKYLTSLQVDEKQIVREKF